MDKILLIDGSLGEGGGQILRTSLTLAMCLKIPITINNIRAGRPKPGLMRQHLACIYAAKEVCSAKVVNAELGSQSVTFIPGDITAGKFHFSVGSAGSTTLIFQTIFLALTQTNEISDVTFEGGTHNPFAPSYDYLIECFKPMVEKLGYKFDAHLENAGYYPAGGGLWRCRIYPKESSKVLSLTTREKIKKIHATVNISNLKHNIFEREKNVLKEQLDLRDNQITEKNLNSIRAGNAVGITIESGNAIEYVESLGAKGLAAEKVAREVAGKTREYIKNNTPVGEYLSDQLILPMLLGNDGEFVTSNISSHLKTNIDTANKVLKENKIYSKTLRIEQTNAKYKIICE